MDSPSCWMRSRKGIVRSTEQLDETGVTVRFVGLLFERALVQQLQTVRTDKVLRVELAEHGGDATAGDWLLATGRADDNKTSTEKTNPQLQWTSNNTISGCDIPTARPPTCGSCPRLRSLLSDTLCHTGVQQHSHP